MYATIGHRYSIDLRCPVKTLNYIIGFPILKSLSPDLHQYLYKKLGISASMKAFSCEQIESVSSILNKESTGFIAVTMPHKSTILNYCDELSEIAQQTQSVNMLFKKNGRWQGENTDYIGIARTLESVNLKGKKILLLGAGGAARTFAHFSFQKQANLFFCNRNNQAANQLANFFQGNSVAFEKLNQYHFDGIVNATPLGMSHLPDTRFFSEKIFSEKPFVFDMVYHPLETQLIQKAKQANCQIFSGLTMLIYQAIEQIRLWKQYREHPDIHIESCVEYLKDFL